MDSDTIVRVQSERKITRNFSLMIGCLLVLLCSVDIPAYLNSIPIADAAAEHVWDEDDFYSLLGLQPDAEISEIKRAYRRLSLQFHPDKEGGDQKKFTQVARAYEVLSDPAKRRAYDQNGEEGVEQLEHPRGGGDPFGGFFGNFFGFESQNSGPKTMRNLEISLTVSLEDLYSGRVLHATGYRQGICKKCRGTGAHTKKDIKPCTKCDGKGVVVKMMQIHPGMYQQVQQNCQTCSGKGKVIAKKCQFCSGTRISENKVNYKVTVEKGSKDGTRITFPHSTDETPDAVAGEVVFKIQTADHPTFTRQGDDLHTTVWLSLKESLLGFEKEIKQLDGRSIVLSRENQITPPEFKENIKHEGMPKSLDEAGNLIVTYLVEFPKRLSEDQIKALQDLGIN